MIGRMASVFSLWYGMAQGRDVGGSGSETRMGCASGCIGESIYMARPLEVRLGAALNPLARKLVGDWVRGGEISPLVLRYDEVKDWKSMAAILRNGEVEFLDGQESLQIWRSNES